MAKIKKKKLSSTRALRKRTRVPASTTTGRDIQYHNPASVARHKAALIAELKSQEVTMERQIEIRKELEKEPLASAPILSYHELRRLDG